MTANGCNIDYKASVTNLGLIIRPTITWAEQVNKICKSIHYTLYSLRPNYRVLSFQIRSMLINSLVFPSIDYCCPVYDDLSKTLGLELERLLNRGVRFVYGLTRNDHVTIPRLQLGWLSCKSRRKYFKLCLIQNCLRTGKPSYLRQRLLSIDPTLRRSERNTQLSHEVPLQLHIPFARTDILLSSFYISGAKDWNALPAEVKLVNSDKMFKSRIYRILFEREMSTLGIEAGQVVSDIQS